MTAQGRITYRAAFPPNAVSKHSIGASRPVIRMSVVWLFWHRLVRVYLGLIEEIFNLETTKQAITFFIRSRYDLGCAS